MKVELLVTLKGKNPWKKGLILDSEEAPIPSDILAEIKQNKRTVKVLKGDSSPKPAPPENDVSTVDEITEEVVDSFDSIVANVTTDLLSESKPEELPVNDDIDPAGTSTNTTENQDPTEATAEKQETEEPTENDFECDICHNPFSSPKGLKVHKTKMHKEKK